MDDRESCMVASNYKDPSEIGDEKVLGSDKICLLQSNKQDSAIPFISFEAFMRQSLTIDICKGRSKTNGRVYLIKVS